MPRPSFSCAFPPSERIVEYAQTHNIDLIVLSSHGRSGLGRLIMGSVAEAVLRGTTVPVCIVRALGAPLEVPKDKAEAKAGKAPVSV